MKVVTFAAHKPGTKPRHVIDVRKDESEVVHSLCFVQGASDKARNEAFSHEWTAYQASIFEPNKTCCSSGGKYSMRSGTKSDFRISLLDGI